VQLASGRGWGKKTLGLDRAIPLRKFVSEIPRSLVYGQALLKLLRKSGEASMRLVTGIAIIIAASAPMAQGQSLQEQEICAQQAKAAFQDYKEGAPPGFSDYQSHYNKALNKCFIVINQKSKLNGQPLIVTELHDAVERHWFASYTQLTKEGKEYLLSCELKPTSQEKETICKSKQEFDAFVSKYMEQ
jgi:hypothetical protein